MLAACVTFVIKIALVVGSFGFLILVHELGHFVVARWSGVRILRFSIGFGRRLCSWKRGETEYWVSMIPLGGYVKMAGEQHAEQSHEPGEYLSKPVGVRAAIILAGPAVNYLTAIVIMWLVFCIGFPELSPVIGEVKEGMPAFAAGVKTGDRVQQINGQAVRTWDEVTKLIQAAPDQAVQLAIERAGQTQMLTVRPKAEDATDPFGTRKRVGRIGVSPNGDLWLRRTGPLAAIGQSLRQTTEWSVLTLQGLASMVQHKVPFKESVSGPIGIGMLTWDAVTHLITQVFGRIPTQGLSALVSQEVALALVHLLILISLVSLGLAIFNVFPIPILDGGHLLFLAIEKIRRGRPVSMVVQERVTQVSFVLLMTLVAFICVNDIERFGIAKKVLEWVHR